MDVGGRDQRQRAHPRPIDRFPGQQRRLGMGLLEVFQDGERLVSTSPESSTSAGTSFCGLIAT